MTQFNIHRSFLQCPPIAAGEDAASSIGTLDVSLQDSKNGLAMSCCTFQIEKAHRQLKMYCKKNTHNNNAQGRQHGM
jgi:hypothetical protein